MANNHNDDNVQHGIDDNPHGDAGKGALLGGLGGAAVGAMAGGPVGAVIGAVAGAIGSGAAVAAVDTVDNDNTVTGIGDGATGDVENTVRHGHPNEPSRADSILTGGTTHTDTNYVAPGATAHDTNVRDTNVTDRDTIRVPVVEEEINVQKNVQQAGEVQVHKDVITEQVNIPVEVTREEVVVTRHAVDRDLAPGETTLGGEEVLRVPVMEENVTVNKTAHVVEEIEIGKHRTTEQQTVTDTVRKEVVDVDDTTTRVDNRNNNL
jgi:uncharacterized protein (TIGR02271 family)